MTRNTLWPDTVVRSLQPFFSPLSSRCVRLGFLRRLKRLKHLADSSVRAAENTSAWLSAWQGKTREREGASRGREGRRVWGTYLWFPWSSSKKSPIRAVCRFLPCTGWSVWGRGSSNCCFCFVRQLVLPVLSNLSQYAHVCRRLHLHCHINNHSSIPVDILRPVQSHSLFFFLSGNLVCTWSYCRLMFYH